MALCDVMPVFSTEVLHSGRTPFHCTSKSSTLANNKVTAIPVLAWTRPERSRRLRLQDFQTIDTWMLSVIAPIAFTHREIFLGGKDWVDSGAIVRPEELSERKIPTRNLQARNAVPEPTAWPRASVGNNKTIMKAWQFYTFPKTVLCSSNGSDCIQRLNRIICLSYTCNFIWAGKGVARSFNICTLRRNLDKYIFYFTLSELPSIVRDGKSEKKSHHKHTAQWYKNLWRL